MEEFVKKLFIDTTDLSNLTQKIVKEKYKAHIGKESLSQEEKIQLKGVVVQAVFECQQKNKEEIASDNHEKENLIANENLAALQKESPLKKGKRTYSDVLSDDNKDPNSPGHQRTKKFKSEDSEVHDCKSENDKQSPKKVISQDTETKSPEKSLKKLKARKRLSPGDVRDSIFDGKEENISLSSSSESDNESDQVENNQGKENPKNLTSSENNSESGSEEYGSPFKDESGVIDKEELASDLESFIADSESDFTPVKKTKKFKVNKKLKSKSVRTESKSNDTKELDENLENENESPLVKAKKWKQKLKKRVLLDSESDCSPMKNTKQRVNDDKNMGKQGMLSRKCGEKQNMKEKSSEHGSDEESVVDDSEEESLAKKKSKVVKKRNKNKKPNTDDNDFTDSEDESLAKKKSKLDKIGTVKSNSSGSESEDDSLVKKKNKVAKANEVSNNYSDSDDESLANIKSKLAKSVKNSSDSSDSDDESLAKKKNKLAKTVKYNKSSDEEDGSLAKKKSRAASSNSSSNESCDDKSQMKKNSNKSSASESSDNESLAKKKQNLKDKSSGSESSDNESLAKKKQNLKDKSSGNESSDNESLAKNKQNLKDKVSKEATGSSSDESSESNDDESLSKLKQKLDNKKSIKSSDSESSDDESLAKKKQILQNKAKKKKAKSKSSEEDNIKSKSEKNKKVNEPIKTSNILRLEKIAKYIGAMPIGRRYTQCFDDCTTAKKRQMKLKQILVDAGMEGIPSMKKAKELKIKKEVMELGSSQIIEDSGRGKRRNVYSLYAKESPYLKAQIKEETSPPPVTVKHDFKNLKGIIDSDSESD